MGDCNIKVIVRFRPMNKREIELGDSHINLDFKGGNTALEITGNLPQGQSSASFDFDHIFPPTSTQVEVFEALAKPTVRDILGGYNGTIFAYGQTGAGKSFTMMGASIDDLELRGIIPRSSAEIFNMIANDKSGVEYQVKCSYFEIYNEMIQDLLDPSRKNLKIHESPSRGVYIADLSEEYCAHEGEIYDLLDVGATNRAVSSTQMNAVSSRSHSVFIIMVQQKNPDGSTKTGRLNLVDLAGSEKVGKTGAQGQTLEEAKKINQSLSALGNCIHALTDSKKSHIPYRDSKLTRVLQDSLGGNTKTTLMCGASPHENNVEETISTLRFGARAKTIKNSVKANVQRSAAELQKMLDSIKKELADARGINEYLEKQIAWYKSAVPTGISLPADLAQAPLLLTTGSGEDQDDSTRSTSASDPKKQSSSGTTSGSSSHHHPSASLEAIDRIAELQAELERARDQIETLKGDLLDKHEDTAWQNKEMLELKQSVVTLTSELDAVKDQLKESDKMRAEEKRKSDAHAKIKEEEISDITEELQVALSDKQDAQSKLAQLQREIQALSAENEELTEELENLKLENEAMFEELAELQDGKLEAEEKVEKLEDELAKAKRRLNDLQADLKERDETEEETLEAIHELEEQLQAVELHNEELDSVIKLKNSSEISLKQELDKAHKEIESLMNDLEESATLLMETEESLTKTQQELQQMKNGEKSVSSSTSTSTPASSIQQQSNATHLISASTTCQQQVSKPSILPPAHYSPSPLSPLPTPSSPSPSQPSKRATVTFGASPLLEFDSSQKSSMTSFEDLDTSGKLSAPSSLPALGGGAGAGGGRTRSRASSLFVPPAPRPILPAAAAGAATTDRVHSAASVTASLNRFNGVMFGNTAELQGQLTAANEKIQKLNETILKFEAQVRRLTLDKESLEKKLDHEKTKGQGLQTKYNDEHVLVQSLQDELDKLRRMLEKKEKEVTSVEKEDDRKKEHITKLDNEIKELKNKLESVKADAAKTREERTRVESELKDEKTKFMLATQKLERNQKRMDDLQQEISTLHESQLTAERQRDEMKRERDSLKLAVDQKDSTIKDSQSLIESLQQQLTRPKRAWKPVSSGSGKPTAFAEKIEFGQFMLKKTESRFAKEVEPQKVV